MLKKLTTAIANYYYFLKGTDNTIPHIKREGLSLLSSITSTG